MLVEDPQGKLGLLSPDASLRVRGGFLDSLEELDKRIQSLCLEKVRLIKLDLACIGKLGRLSILSLHSLGLVSLPVEIAQLQHLQYLYLYGNKLDKLPAGFARLKLVSLGLDHNQFVKFPLVLSSMKSLRILNLEDNFIQRLPNTDLKLSTLLASGNQIGNLPSWLFHCGYVGLRRNPVYFNTPITTDAVISCDRVGARLLSYEKSLPYLYTFPIECINSTQYRALIRVGFLL